MTIIINGESFNYIPAMEYAKSVNFKIATIYSWVNKNVIPYIKVIETTKKGKQRSRIYIPEGTKVPYYHTNKSIAKKLDWPQNLYKAAFNDPDFEVNVDDLLKPLTSFKLMVIESLFKDHKTLQQVGDSVGKTREYIRQIKERALHEIKFRYWYLNAPEHDKHIFDTLRYFGLSKRSYNALRRGDIFTFEELKKRFDDGTIIKLRNLGAGGIKEIEEIANKISDGKFSDYATKVIEKEDEAYFEPLIFNNTIAHSLLRNDIDSPEALVEAIKNHEKPLIKMYGIGNVKYGLIVDECEKILGVDLTGYHNPYWWWEVKT